jgi:hypothetical protein
MVAMGNGDEKSRTPPAEKEGGVRMSIDFDFRGFASFGSSVVCDKHCVRSAASAPTGSAVTQAFVGAEAIDLQNYNVSL